MPTIFTHPAVPLGLSPVVRRLPISLLLVACFCSSMPDADVAAFGFGIPYEHPFGHRGFTHSILFAILLAAFAAFAHRRLTRSSFPFRASFLFLFISIASHGVLDAMTTGGRGVGFFIPFSNRRFFLPFRPIRVSPIGADDFAERARAVLTSELLWVWLPCAAIALALLIGRRLSARAARET
jgi:inner membrane protein